MLLEELAWVEEEIILLEAKVKQLKLQLYTETEQTREWEIHPRRSCKHRYGSVMNDKRYRSHNLEVFTEERIPRNINGKTITNLLLFYAFVCLNFSPQLIVKSSKNVKYQEEAVER